MCGLVYKYLLQYLLFMNVMFILKRKTDSKMRCKTNTNQITKYFLHLNFNNFKPLI